MKQALVLFFIVLLLTACRRDQSYLSKPILFSKVLILGNSITFTPANPTQGWDGSWGMAATAADSDYVHLLTVKFKQQNTNCKVTAINISRFETGFTTFNLDSALLTYRNTYPDLVIIRIGENVPNGFNTSLFDTKYAALINYFKIDNPNVKIFAAGSFFEGKAAVDAEMEKYSPFMSLSYLAPDSSNESWGLYTNYSIESHPSNKGMKAIANGIWPHIESLQ